MTALAPHTTPHRTTPHRTDCMTALAPPPDLYEHPVIRPPLQPGRQLQQVSKAAPRQAPHETGGASTAPAPATSRRLQHAPRMLLQHISALLLHVLQQVDTGAMHSRVVPGGGPPPPSRPSSATACTAWQRMWVPYRRAAKVK